MWYAYDVTEIHTDMLRYDGGYVYEVPALANDATRYGPGNARYEGGTVVSRIRPTTVRWNSFGIRVSNVRLVDKPTGEMWTCKRPNWDSASEWVKEAL